MPKYKQDTIEFELKVTDDGQRVKITVPGVLYQRLNNATEIYGRFILTRNKIVLTEEKRGVTVKQLCSKWRTVPNVESIEEVYSLDWDEILARLGVYLTEEGKSAIISDWDSTTYDQFAIIFSEE